MAVMWRLDDAYMRHDGLVARDGENHGEKRNFRHNDALVFQVFHVTYSTVPEVVSIHIPWQVIYIHVYFIYYSP